MEPANRALVLRRALALAGAVTLLAVRAGAGTGAPGARELLAASPFAPRENAVASGTNAEDPDCLRCHAKIQEAVKRPVPHKPAADGDCTGCHSPHASRHENLLTARERALCNVCHRERVAEFMKGSVHTPVKQGECTACHEVHGSLNAGLLAREGNELCLGCHKQHAERQKSTSVHDPFVNGACLDCHKAHNSAVKNQLIAPQDRMCQVCHPAEEQKYVDAHNGIPIKGTQCTKCHDPHASTNKKLLRKVAHVPFADGSCDMCHLVDSPTPQVVRATGGKLCAACHRDTPRHDDKVVHKPVAERNCNACHVPHASDNKGLLASPAPELCSSCHADLVERGQRSKSVHPLKTEKATCTSCHAPHSSNEEHLLLNGPIRTCVTCHQTATHGHPLGEDRLDPRTQKPITCVTCHDPHGTQFSYSLRGDQSRGLCVECHNADHDKVRDGPRK